MGAPVGKHPTKICKGYCCAACECRPVGRIGTARQVEKHHAWADVILTRDSLKCEQGLVTDATRRHVDDAPQTCFICRVMNETQKGNNILDLAPSIKPLRANQTIGKSRLQESLFQQTRHCIRAIHHCTVTWLKLTRSNQLCNTIHNERRFCIIIGRFIEEYLFT